MKKITFLLSFSFFIFMKEGIRAQNIREVYHNVNAGNPSSAYNSPGTILYPVGYNAFSAKTPVIFVHGITGKLTGSYEANIQEVIQYGIKAAFVQLEPIGTPQENGKLLKKIIDRVRAHYGSATVSIVAHSKGGMDTERALYGPDPDNPSVPSVAYEKVDGVYTFGSPLKGSRVADVGSALSWTGIAWIAMWYLNGYDLTKASVQSFHNWAQSWRINSNGTFRNYYHPNGVTYSRINMIEDNTTRWWAHQSDDPCYENKWYFCYVGNGFHHSAGAYVDAYWEWDWFNSGWRNWHTENDGFIAVYRARREVIQNASPAYTPGAGDFNYITMHDANHTSLWDPGEGHFGREVAPYLHYGLYGGYYRPAGESPEKPHAFQNQHATDYPVYLSNGAFITSHSGKAKLIVEDDNASYEVTVWAAQPVQQLQLFRENQKYSFTPEQSAYFDPQMHAYATLFSFDGLPKGMWEVQVPQTEVLFMTRNLTPTTAFGVKWNINEKTGYEGKDVEIKVSKNPGMPAKNLLIVGILSRIGDRNGLILPDKQTLQVIVPSLKKEDENSYLFTFNPGELEAGSSYAIRIIARATRGESLLQRNAITTFYVPENFPVKTFETAQKPAEDMPEGSIRIFPNPTGSFAYISFDMKGEKTVRIFDMTGKKVWEQTTGSGFVEIPVSHWKKGVYVVRMETGDRTFNGKLSVK